LNSVADILHAHYTLPSDTPSTFLTLLAQTRWRKLIAAVSILSMNRVPNDFRLHITAILGDVKEGYTRTN